MQFIDLIWRNERLLKIQTHLENLNYYDLFQITTLCIIQNYLLLNFEGDSNLSWLTDKTGKTLEILSHENMSSSGNVRDFMCRMFKRRYCPVMSFINAQNINIDYYWLLIVRTSDAPVSPGQGPPGCRRAWTPSARRSPCRRGRGWAPCCRGSPSWCSPVRVGIILVPQKTRWNKGSHQIRKEKWMGISIPGGGSQIFYS